MIIPQNKHVNDHKYLTFLQTIITNVISKMHTNIKLNIQQFSIHFIYYLPSPHEPYKPITVGFSIISIIFNVFSTDLSIIIIYCFSEYICFCIYCPQ